MSLTEYRAAVDTELRSADVLTDVRDAFRPASLAEIVEAGYDQQASPGVIADDLARMVGL